MASRLADCYARKHNHEASKKRDGDRYARGRQLLVPPHLTTDVDSMLMISVRSWSTPRRCARRFVRSWSGRRKAMRARRYRVRHNGLNFSLGCGAATPLKNKRCWYRAAVPHGTSIFMCLPSTLYLFLAHPGAATAR